MEAEREEEEIKWRIGTNYYTGVWVLEHALKIKSCQQDPKFVLTPNLFVNIILVSKFDEKPWGMGEKMELKLHSLEPQGWGTI